PAPPSDYVTSWATSTTATSPWSPKPSRWQATPGPSTKEPEMIANLQAHYGFSRMPFGRELAPGMLHRHDAHNQAAARITGCIQQRALGVLTGEVGAGKTVALRAALAGLDPSRHVLIYLPNPSVGVRGINHAVVAALGGVPRTHHATLVPQALDTIANEHAERGPTPILAIHEAHMLQPPQLQTDPTPPHPP